VKDAARAVGSVPEFATVAGFRIGDANGPGRGRAAVSANCERSGGSSDERNLFAVGRPDGFRVAVDAGIEIVDGLRADVVDGDESVVGARGDISELGAIGRPAELANPPFDVDELRRLGVVIERDGPDFVFAQKDEAVAGG
jgi:hypothetical protein